MKMLIFSIYDEASGLYSRPFFDTAPSVAIRSFGDIANGKDHPISDHPEDYTLYQIGSFQDGLGVIVPENKALLATALELVSAARNVNKDNLQTLDQEISAKELQTISPGGTA